MCFENLPVDFDVAGTLAVHTVLDLENRKAVDAHSRACGVCGGIANYASVNIEMAFGVCPPPLGAEVRNLNEVGEMFRELDSCGCTLE